MMGNAFAGAGNDRGLTGTTPPERSRSADPLGGRYKSGGNGGGGGGGGVDGGFDGGYGGYGGADDYYAAQYGYGCGAHDRSYTSYDGYGGAAPLSVEDLARSHPTIESSLPSRRAMQQEEATREAHRQLAEARLASPMPRGSLPVRALLEPELRAAGSDFAHLNAVARATSSPSSLYPGGGGGRSANVGMSAAQKRVKYGGRYVADPRSTMQVDPWKASEEDLQRRARGQAMSDEMAAVRRAAAVGYNNVPGFMSM